MEHDVKDILREVKNINSNSSMQLSEIKDMRSKTEDILKYIQALNQTLGMHLYDMKRDLEAMREKIAPRHQNVTSGNMVRRGKITSKGT